MQQQGPTQALPKCGNGEVIQLHTVLYFFKTTFLMFQRNAHAVTSAPVRTASAADADRQRMVGTMGWGNG
jgi:hypothetical protein